MSAKYWLKTDIFEVTGRFRSCETTEGRWLLPSINSPYLENQAMSQSEEKAVLKSPGKNFLDLCWQHPLRWVSWATRPKNEYECWKKHLHWSNTLLRSTLGIWQIPSGEVQWLRTNHPANTPGVLVCGHPTTAQPEDEKCGGTTRSAQRTWCHHAAQPGLVGLLSKFLRLFQFPSLQKTHSFSSIMLWEF